ncbi:MAG: TetR/AcrR family transcriptional regulator, partial [Acidimicrobiales bacterium]|nr:TetR/AcrR family transcriptional regulator [Acidimicrobiales bacterium]
MTTASNKPSSAPERGPMSRTTRPAKTARTAQIINAAADLFAERGFDATSIQDIAEASGIRKASLYAHVTHKAQFLQIICDDYITRAVENAQAVYASEGNADEKLRQIVHFLYGSIECYRSHVVVFLQEARYVDGEGFEEVRRKRDGWERIVVAILRDGMATGELRQSDHSRIVAFLLVGMVQWAYRWYRPTGDL